MSERKRSVELFFGRDGKKKTCSMSGCYGGVVAICVTMAIVWTVGPIAVYNSPRGTALTGTLMCTAQAYKGTVCSNVLSNRTLCLNESDPYTYDANSTLQYMREVRAAQELQAAIRNDTTRCEIAVMSYICLNAFDVTSLYDDINNHTDLCTDLTNGSAQLITCSEYFYHDPPSGLCKPTCSVRTTGTLSTFRGLYMFGIVGYVIAFIAACFNHKVMGRFPSILLLYWLISGAIYNIIILINCCTTADYFDNPSLGCQAQDFLLLFLAYLLGMFPLVHTVILFWGVWFPYYSKDFLGNNKKKLCLHVWVLILSLAVPIVVCTSLIAVFMSGGISSQDLGYALLPLYGICGFIAAFVGLTLSKLIKMENQSQNSCFTCTPELKLSLVFTYVIIFSITTVVRHMLQRYRTFGYVDDYFLCESSGHKGCYLQPDSFNAAINGFAAFNNFLFSLSPYASLIYIVPLQLMQMKLRRKLSKPTIIMT